jgi:hypothetical protein
MSSPPLSVRMPAPLRGRLTAAAEQERCSLSQMVRVLFEDGLQARSEEERTLAGLRDTFELHREPSSR